MESSPEICLSIVPRSEQVEALWLLFGDEPEPVRRNRLQGAVQAARQRSTEFDFLLQARRVNNRVGTVWGQPLAGRNANIWPPFLVPGEPQSTADLLQSELDRRLADAGFVTAQALLSVEASAQVGLQRHGYRKVATLLYLSSSSRQFPSTQPASSLQFEPFRDSDMARLTKVIELTYIDTRDAPSLDGTRNVQDVIEGYKSTGEFAPERWFLVRTDGEDVGCLLLTNHPSLQHWELIYMGLIPAARRRGWGSDLVRYAQWQARRAASDALLVSVDIANEPAVAAYARCGFSELARRTAWFKELGDRK